MSILSTEPLPRDEEDERYVRSFELKLEDSSSSSMPSSSSSSVSHSASVLSTEESEALSFFEEYGFVVIRGIFDSSECHKTRDAMWSMVERDCEGFLRDDPTTWGL